MSDQTLYNTTEQTVGTLQLAHEKILRAKINAIFVNITGDANNIAGVPTAVTVARENYGNKGRPSVEKIGDSWVISWDCEAVRDNTGAIAQAWLVSLLNIAKAKGGANKVDLQLFDAKDENLPAIEGSFSLVVVDFATGYADKGGYKFTATSDGVVDDIVSPIASNGLPVIESALPLNAPASANVYIRGYHVDTITAATIGGVAVTSISQIPGEPNIVVLEVPAGTVGSAPIILTNAAGASTAFPYTRGA